MNPQGPASIALKLGSRLYCTVFLEGRIFKLLGVPMGFEVTPQAFRNKSLYLKSNIDIKKLKGRKNFLSKPKPVMDIAYI